MARWAIANMRDSCSGFIVGAMQAATAASVAVRFHAITD